MSQLADWIEHTRKSEDKKKKKKKVKMLKPLYHQLLDLGLCNCVSDLLIKVYTNLSTNGIGLQENAHPTLP